MQPAGSGGGPGNNTSSAESRGTYAGIASINTSTRDNKNVLEIRLEKTESAKFNLSVVEIESLLKKLGIDTSHFHGVSSCPEGKGVIFVTLHPGVNISRFLAKQECYILKEGVKTTRIMKAGNREVSVFIAGLHPNTKDQAVIRYLSAHGKVSDKHKVIHHVYPGEPGSSLLAGKLNGDRSYIMEVIKPMGSFHIIDGEKVSVRYRGQVKTCARCHKTERDCPGKAIARDCQQTRVLLSTHMRDHWQSIGFVPDPGEDSQDEEDDIEIQVGKTNYSNSTGTIKEGPDLSHRYKSLLISGFKQDLGLDQIHEILLENGLPNSIEKSDISINDFDFDFDGEYAWQKSHE